MILEEKVKVLQKLLKEMKEVVVAYSGGVDSTFLLKMAHDVLDSKAYGMLARSPSFPSRDFDDAIRLADDLGIRVEVIETDELNDPNYSSNPTDRCYFCKSELFDKIALLAGSGDFQNIVDGTNYSDLNDHRPGIKAMRERGIRSPLREAGLTKDEIRVESKRLGLPTWEKDELACLSSRFPTGEKINEVKLSMVDNMENYLVDLGFRNVRARHQNDELHIEVDRSMVDRFEDTHLQNIVLKRALEIGYKQVSVDLDGYGRGKANGIRNPVKNLKTLRSH